ncbi:DUF1428 domain-containing protein [Alteromonas ponticola]|uniref:DUF1428 family protein n=1 Tax=Alteromonas ponticola TaxID=2720613 RepID=A0ABX1R4C3_9ALTE|nr:DUF1428 family protein [Alteromonas ponticola]NMH60336.1 DUF1428 family protein [Alteromonas ponticola]
MQYIDGFAFPIASHCLDNYRQLAAEVALIWKEHGALHYCEFTGDDMLLAGTRSFTDALEVNEDETVIFGWVAFASREDRDRANAKVATDSRMASLMASIETGFDASRMVYGGFHAFTDR